MTTRQATLDDARARLVLADDLFTRALDIETSERYGFLVGATDGDADLLAVVQGLLRSANLTDTLLDSGGALHEGFWQHLEPEALKEQMILGGRYRIARELGRGGMGVVYLAHRADGQFEQRVALKVIRHGASAQTSARFLRERQILAGLTHPNIARLLDGGVGPSGQPYLVMEYVEGRPIDRYCREEDIDLTARLMLLCDVCEAVQAAHRQLIVHRDLKPSNILVTASGTVKLLDFGIAKLLSDASEKTPEGWGGMTQTDGQVMTPQYASPEQFRGETISVASDVYQLGLVAYELLSGRLPYDLGDCPPMDAVRHVCDEMPQPPSTAVSAVETTPRDRREALRRRLMGDLDAIVLKALHKDAEQRYRSVDHLRDDVRRYLQGQPVLARPDRLSYRLGKFCRRNRWGVAASVAVLALLVSLTIAFTSGLARERDRTRVQASVAQTQSRQAEEVVNFLVDLFKEANPRRFAGQPPTVREILDQGAVKVDVELADQPLARARLSHTIGRIYNILGDYERAEGLLNTSLELWRSSPEEHPLRIAEVYDGLAKVALWKGDPEAACSKYEAALELRLSAPAVSDLLLSQSHHGLSVCLQNQGRWAAAEAEERQALAMIGDSDGLLDRRAVYLDGLANSLANQGKIEASRAVSHEILAMESPEFGPLHPSRGAALSNLGISYAMEGDFAAAVPMFRQALEIQQRAFGPDHPDSGTIAGNLATAYMELERFDEAEVVFRRVLELRRSQMGETHPETARSLVDLGHLSLRRGEADGAESRLRQALQILDQTVAESDPFRGLALVVLGQSLSVQRRYDEAAETLNASLRILEAAHGPGHSLVAIPVLELGRLYEAQGRLGDAERWLLRALTIRRTAEGVGERDLQEAEDAYSAVREARTAATLEGALR